jgi:DnaK suppressor protein
MLLVLLEMRSVMSPQFTHRRLKAFRQEIEELLESLLDELKPREVYSREVDRSEVSDRAEEADRDWASLLTRADLNRQLTEIKACHEALSRLDSGHYGECIECGESIELNRLNANPVTLRCLVCQAEFEKENSHTHTA